METKFGGLFLEVEDAAGLNGRGLLKGFRFSVDHAAHDDRGENPRELARHGGNPFGHSQPTFHPTTILAVLVLAIAQGGGHAADDFGQIKGRQIKGQVSYRPKILKRQIKGQVSYRPKILKRSLALKTPLLISFSPDAHPAASHAAIPTRPARINKMFGDARVSRGAKAGQIKGQVSYRPSPPHSCPFVVKNPPLLPEKPRL